MEVDAPAPSSSEPLRLSDEDLPAGHPALRPGHEVCFVSRCDELDVVEAHLRLALLAVAPDGSGAGVTADAMRSAVLGINGIDGRGMAVRKFSPEQFLIVFATQADRDCAFRAGWISVATSRFLLRPWTRLVRAEAVSLRFRVSVEMEGVPAHAASLRTARKILSSSCWIERLAPSSEDKSDQSVLKLTAWTDNPCRIPRTVTLLIAEHVRPDTELQVIFGNLPPSLRSKEMLSYPVLIHLRSTADFRSRMPSTTSPSPPPGDDDGDGHDGNPDRGYGDCWRGPAPPRVSLPTRRG